MDKTLTLVDKLLSSADQLQADTDEFHSQIVRHTRQEWEAYKLLRTAAAYLRTAASSLLDDYDARSVAK